MGHRRRDASTDRRLGLRPQRPPCSRLRAQNERPGRREGHDPSSGERHSITAHRTRLFDSIDDWHNGPYRVPDIHRSVRVGPTVQPPISPSRALANWSVEPAIGWPEDCPRTRVRPSLVGLLTRRSETLNDTPSAITPPAAISCSPRSGRRCWRHTAPVIIWASPARPDQARGDQRSADVPQSGDSSMTFSVGLGAGSYRLVPVRIPEYA
jgi:hypothetical protein